MVGIKIIVYKKLPRRLQIRVKLFDRECFPWIYETELRMQKHLDKFSPSVKNQIGHVCALFNNELAGRIVIMKRKVMFQDQPIILGGIAGVCVCPVKRKYGLATRLLKKAMEELKLAGCDIAYLCTDVENQGYLNLYGKFGFKLLGRPQTYLSKSGKRYIDHDAMIAPVNSTAIFKAVMAGKENLNIGTGNW